MRGVGAGSIKVAVAVSRLTETLPLKRHRRRGRRGRDRHGRGGCAVATAGRALRIDVGRMPAAVWRQVRFRPRRWPTTFTSSASVRRRGFSVSSARTRLHSLSPVMHNAAFEAAGIDAVYVPLRASDFDDFLAYAAAMGSRARASRFRSSSTRCERRSRSDASDADRLARRTRFVAATRKGGRRRTPTWTASSRRSTRCSVRV